MSRKKASTLFAIVLALLMTGVSAVSAESPRPECDRRDGESLCQANITVFVFVDHANGGCDAFYDSGVDAPLEGARLTFVMPDGSRAQRTTGRTGLLSFPSVDFLPGDEAFIEIEYPAQYRGSVLLPCPSSPVRRRLTRDSFGAFGSVEIVFYAGRYLATSSFSSEGE